MSSEEGGEGHEIRIAQGASPVLVLFIDEGTFTGSNNVVIGNVVHLSECSDNTETDYGVGDQVPNELTITDSTM